MKHTINLILVLVLTGLFAGPHSTIAKDLPGKPELHATDVAPISADEVVWQANLTSSSSDSTAMRLRLQIYDSPVEGQALSEPIYRAADPNAHGRFEASIPIAAVDHSSTGTWLEISVLDEQGRVTTLSPRQPMDGSQRVVSMSSHEVRVDSVIFTASGAEAPDTDARLASAGGYGELMNISTRGFVGNGDAVMIAGFIVDQPTAVMVRAIGPSLAASGVPGVLADPTVELYRGSSRIDLNDDWRDDELSSAIASAFNLQPSHDFESVLVAVVDQGAYTVIVRGLGNTTGIGLVEVFQLGRALAPQAQVVVNNDTGAGLCYEVHGSGLGEKCFGPGRYTYGIFPAGTYAYTVRGVCGTLREANDYPEGFWEHRFWCGPSTEDVPTLEGQMVLDPKTSISH